MVQPSKDVLASSLDVSDEKPYIARHQFKSFTDILTIQLSLLGWTDKNEPAHGFDGR
ncbi:MAG: hypothetical protein AB7U82_16805 [Blastocatellales bacterium]